MKFVETPLADAYVIEPVRIHDERGFFTRSFCANDFAEHGMFTKIAQCNVSFNATKGTLRGMHFQVAPYEEAKLVRCTRGAIWDAIIDLRPNSPTFKQWFGAELSDTNHRSLYIPEGFAHGFITLTDAAEVYYMMSEFYQPGAGRGVRWDDPEFGIEWPADPTLLNDRDASYPDFSPLLLQP